MVTATAKGLSKPITAADREAFSVKQTQERWASLRAIWKQTGITNADAVDPTTLPQLVPLTEQRIADCLKILDECERTWQIERQVMIYFHNSEIHKHPSINCESFGLFLARTFSRKRHLRYQKEVAIARREELLGIPIATYSRDQFRRMERFRCFVPIGGVQDKAGGKLQGVRPGVKRDELQIARLKECWQIACELSDSNRPETHHLESAAEEMNRRYPGEYPDLKPRSSRQIWKNRAITAEKKLISLQSWEKRAILAENRVAELETRLAQLTTGANK
jgi:hypothetical protein